jgi:hypothetical protein
MVDTGRDDFRYRQEMIRSICQSRLPFEDQRSLKPKMPAHRGKRPRAASNRNSHWAGV